MSQYIPHALVMNVICLRNAFYALVEDNILIVEDKTIQTDLPIIGEYVYWLSYYYVYANIHNVDNKDKSFSENMVLFYTAITLFFMHLVHERKFELDEYKYKHFKDILSHVITCAVSTTYKESLDYINILYTLIYKYVSHMDNPRTKIEGGKRSHTYTTFYQLRLALLAAALSKEIRHDNQLHYDVIFNALLILQEESTDANKPLLLKIICAIEKYINQDIKHYKKREIIHKKYSFFYNIMLDDVMSYHRKTYTHTKTMHNLYKDYRQIFFLYIRDMEVVPDDKLVTTVQKIVYPQNIKRYYLYTARTAIKAAGCKLNTKKYTRDHILTPEEWNSDLKLKNLYEYSLSTEKLARLDNLLLTSEKVAP